MAHKYSVAIIGAGRIAAGFDSPDAKNILTHAHAFSANKRTKLLGFYDTDTEKAQAEAERWKTAAFANIDELLNAKPDIIVIASPDETHARYLKTIDGKCSVIVFEKPVAIGKEEVKDVESIATPTIVNFRRRFDPTIINLKSEIAEGAHGRVIGAVGTYSKGLMHNGSHMIDLARFLFGEMTFAQKLSSTKDWEGGETVSAFCMFEKCSQFHLAAGDERAYSIFELDILTEKKRFRFLDEGFILSEQKVIPDPVFKGFEILGQPKIEKTGLIDSMALMAQHAVEVLERAESHAPLEEAVKTHRACLKILGGE